MSPISLSSSLIALQAHRPQAASADAPARPVQPAAFTPTAFRVPGEDGTAAPTTARGDQPAPSAFEPQTQFRREAPLASERPAYQPPGANLDITI